MGDYPQLRYRKGNLMSGPAVTRFQQLGEALIDEDFLKEDGVFGKDSKDLAIKIQEMFGLNADGVVGTNTWNVILVALGRLTSGAEIYMHNESLVVDNRDYGMPPKKLYFGVVRDWSKIEGVMLHQTGCRMSENESVWQPVNAHCGVTREGKIILMHNFQWEIWHGHNLSPETIGIEVEGNFYGMEGVKGTFWKQGGGPHELNDMQKTALDNLFDLIHVEFDKNGGKFTKVFAHRQASDQRENDPGESIWKYAGVPWQEKLGADDGGEGYKVKSGKPIPREWDARRKARFWG